MITKKRHIGTIAMIVVAICIDTAGVAFFILPYQFPVAGITGISRILQKSTGLPVSVGVAILSVAMLLIGFIFLGKEFAARTFLASLAYPVFLAMWESIASVEPLLQDRMLAVAFGGLISGVGIGLCVRNGSSTGGTDLIGVLAYEKFHLPVAITTYSVDFLVLGGQAFLGEVEETLYGLLLLLVSTCTMNKVITWGANGVQIMIISSHYREINEIIQRHTDIGTTLLHGKTGRFGIEEDLILCTARSKEVKIIRDIVGNIDPCAFMTMTNTSNVYGRGFSLDPILKDIS